MPPSIATVTALRQKMQKDCHGVCPNVQSTINGFAGVDLRLCRCFRLSATRPPLSCFLPLPPAIP